MTHQALQGKEAEILHRPQVDDQGLGDAEWRLGSRCPGYVTSVGCECRAYQKRRRGRTLISCPYRRSNMHGVQGVA